MGTGELVTMPAEAAAMCECGHHWSVHAESGQTAPSAVCHGYVGSATPGPLREPCRCQGFAQWPGPTDSRTGEPVRPLTLATDSRVAAVPPAAVTAATQALTQAMSAGELLSNQDVARVAVAAAAPHIAAPAAEAERERIRQLAISVQARHCDNCARGHYGHDRDTLGVFADLLGPRLMWSSGPSLVQLDAEGPS